MHALVVVDAQNEFAPGSQRTVSDHAAALQVIRARIAEARGEGRPIAFGRHHNRGDDANAFVPGRLEDLHRRMISVDHGGRLGEALNLSDAGPVLLTTVASLRQLND